MTNESETDLDDASDARRDTRRHQIAARRYRAECSGVVVDGQRFEADRDSQGRVVGAVVAAQQALAAGQPFSLGWKTRGGWAQLDAEQMVAVANAVMAHVQACFERESEMLDALDAGEYTDARLGTGWPT